MASQRLIFGNEEAIIGAKLTVRETTEAARDERDYAGQLHPENRDAWGTLRLNALELRNALNDLLKELAREFED